MKNIDTKRVNTILSETVKGLAEGEAEIIPRSVSTGKANIDATDLWYKNFSYAPVQNWTWDGGGACIGVDKRGKSIGAIVHNKKTYVYDALDNVGGLKQMLSASGLKMGKVYQGESVLRRSSLAEIKGGPLSDEQVIDLFTDKAAGASKKLISNGTRLDGLWMGGNGIATWENGKIVFTDLGSKAADKYQRMVRKIAPKSYLAIRESVDLQEEVRPGQWFCIVDVSVPGGKMIGGLYRGVAGADKECEKLRESGTDAQVIDAKWYVPAYKLMQAI